MLHARLLLSPYAHARIISIDASAALAMPGVKAILTADDVPGPKDQVNDTGQTIRANPRSEKALTNEPLYQGEPVLAVAAIDELTAAEAIEKIKIRWEPLPFNVDPVASLLPGAMNRARGRQRLDTADARPGSAAGRSRGSGPEMDRGRSRGIQAGRLPMSKYTDPAWTLGDVEAGFKKAALVLDETFVTPNTSHQCLEARTAMAYWQNGKLYIHLSTQSIVQTVFSLCAGSTCSRKTSCSSANTCGGGYGAKGRGRSPTSFPRCFPRRRARRC